MKPLRPSMKENKRYLIVKGKDFMSLEQVILEFIGVLGMARTSLSWIKRDKDQGVICVNREALNEVRASFAASSKDITVTRVSGTLKGLKKNNNSHQKPFK